jgi:phosphopantothenoylcysteine decarboxylase
MANILLGVTGSVAAVKTPQLFEQLKAHGHAVKVAATPAGLYFFDPAALDPHGGKRNPDVVILDEDEWPGRAEGKRFQLGEEVPHIALRRWADLLLIAPLDANTLAKLANGLSDNCLTCVWRAWDPSRPVVLAPAMNTLMWEHPMTLRHIRQVGGDMGSNFIPETMELDEAMGIINHTSPCLRVVPPVSKRLACGDVGVGAMAEVSEIVAAVETMLRHGERSATPG